MPADHRVGLHDDESVGPVPPGVAKEHPEYPIRRAQSGSAVPLLEDGQLLAQGEVLDHQFQSGPEQDPGKSNRQCPNEANHAASIAGGRPLGKAKAFLARPEGPRNQPLRNNVEGQGCSSSTTGRPHAFLDRTGSSSQSLANPRPPARSIAGSGWAAFCGTITGKPRKTGSVRVFGHYGVPRRQAVVAPDAGVEGAMLAHAQGAQQVFIADEDQGEGRRLTPVASSSFWECSRLSPARVSSLIGPSSRAVRKGDLASDVSVSTNLTPATELALLASRRAWSSSGSSTMTIRG